MKLKKRLLFVVLLVNIYAGFSQTPVLTEKDSIIKSSWIVGLGYHFVEDSGEVFDNLLNFDSTWNAVSYPSRISVGKYFENGLGLELIGAYLKYNSGTIVDKQTLEESSDFLSIDTRLSYDLNKLIGETGWFDPYAGVGIGYTDARNAPRGTYNAVLGFRTWFSERIGLDFNASGKWAMNFTPETTNYKQYAAGVVYRFGAKKKLTEEGEEKVSMIEQLNQERVNDSIAFAQEQEKALKEKLAKEKEQARLAKIEAEKEQARAEERNKIEETIKALDKVNFNFSSASMKPEAKATILKLAKILQSHPNLVIEISSHTDSRGAKDFNQKLSEKRLKATIDYLLSLDVNAEHIVGKAFGEDKLLNECDDNTKCTEAKHKVNRRSEFKILQH
ncbi:OmpA family protein [Tamlana sp. 62-3]|uniref:OmpA family protein n=1 Tax=Neotamlana sargassicola TaxID=2883125 RepID=A0A9X1I7Z9_9FLAO|nr:OmpA family protein [Tamlana sargassicola]MCB4808615.1 OmpA family protein [Tamlana sargassicola]